MNHLLKPEYCKINSIKTEQKNCCKKNDQITFVYCDPAGNDSKYSNPNGSLENIAGITNITRNVYGMMPHPERGMFFTQRDDWTGIMEKHLRYQRMDK